MLLSLTEAGKTCGLTGSESAL